MPHPALYATGQSKEAGPTSSRLASLDALRGVAALMVFFYHYSGMTTAYTKGAWLMEGFESVTLFSGSLGTNLLLMLSGLFIGKSIIKTDFSYAEFIGKKFFRLYIPYVALLIAALGFWAMFPSFSKLQDGDSDLQYFLHQLVLIPGLFPERPVLTVSWTLSYIFAGYLVLPLFAQAYHRLRPAANSLAPLWVAFVICVALNSYYDGWPIFRVSYIPAGCLISEILRRHGAVFSKRSQIWGASCVAAVLYALRYLLSCFGVASGLERNTISLFHFLCGLGFVSIVTLMFVAFGPVFGRRFASWYSIGLQYLGKRGYSFYLTHGAVTKVLVRLALSEMPSCFSAYYFSPLLLAICLISAIAVAHVSYLLLEVGVPKAFTAMIRRLKKKQPVIAAFANCNRTSSHVVNTG